MTCIVGIKTPRGVVLAADTMLSDSYTKATKLKSKLFTVGPVTMGVSGSVRYANLLENKLADELPDLIGDVDDYMYGDFLDAVIKIFEAGRALETSDGVAYVHGHSLVAVAGRLFTFESNLSLYEVADDYAATGSGQEVALGALYATLNTKNAKRRAEIAVKAACEHTLTVGGHRIDILEART